MTSFVGRRHATSDVKRLMSRSRLVTLTGVGGVGKSRLALRVAGDIQRVFADGAWLVELADVQDPALVDQTVAAALELRDQSVGDPETLLIRQLRDKHLLIVLDNCEHVLPACRQLVAALLPAAPGVHVLATSRAPLGVSGEHVWAVPALSVPGTRGTDADMSPVDRSASRYEALRLFEDRAAAVLPGFVVNRDNQNAVALLCRRLDGLPLAIELAAVQVRVLSVEQILDRLQDRYRLLIRGSRVGPPRHQTLQAAIDWSYALCSATEQALWARCSVFAGDFDLEAVESICVGDASPEVAVTDVLALVTGLVEKSVLVRDMAGDSARFRLLETIREYGRERLVEAGQEDEFRQRHRDYYLRMAEQADAGSSGPHQAQWGARLRAERANFWAALDFSLTEPGEAGAGLRLASDLWFYWIAGGFIRDGRYWLDRALTLNTEPSPERARALWINGWAASLQADTDSARVLLAECRDLARDLGDTSAATRAIQFLGMADLFDNNLTSAARLLDEALAGYRKSGRWDAPALIAYVARADAACMRGDLDRSLALAQECQRICAGRGERWAASWAEWIVGLRWWVAGDRVKGSSHLRGCLRSKDDLNDLLGIPFCLEVLAWVAASDEDAHRAAVLFGAAEMMWKPIGAQLFGYEILLDWSQQSRARSRGALGEAAYDAARHEGASLTQAEAVAMALGEKVTSTKPPAAAPVTAAATLLTKREREVATLVHQGRTNREIAAELVISRRTAEAHVENILTKFGFTSRAQIAGWVASQQQW
ncbi:LuxR C-terminal-related transcriptional regulator [Actinopolymorpha sp. B17G11]|uniref:ATP-binding protein n=1 Tax=Actinopolymorpha sp. B17G11 TaxID=3160861 RepID=UPI0032E3CAB3